MELKVQCWDKSANWFQDWERPVHIEFFEPTGSLGFSIDAGVKIHGNCTRLANQKSLQINARGEYGSSVIPYKIFSMNYLMMNLVQLFCAILAMIIIELLLEML